MIPRRLLDRSVERREAAVRLVSGGLLPASGIDGDGRRFSVQHIAGGMPQYYIELNDTARVTTAVGRHELAWDGTTGEGAQVASGVYFCRLEAGGTVDVRKMILLR